MFVLLTTVDDSRLVQMLFVSSLPFLYGRGRKSICVSSPLAEI